MDLPGVPNALLDALRAAARELACPHLAFVGGVVRDGLLHQRHGVAWRGVPDLDLVVEGDARQLALSLQRICGSERLTSCREHGSFGTVELCLDGVLLDLATARRESYPAPGENPVVQAGTLQADLVRRDFSVNAMAFDLISGELIDPHGGQRALQRRSLELLHRGSISDDPTRVVRAARYAARLDFDLAEDSLEQIRHTLERWPWSGSTGDARTKAPPALSTRLRMELDRLFQREPWETALPLLQGWDAMSLLDSALQHDPAWLQRLMGASRLGVPLLPALLLGAADSIAVAKRLDLPGQQVKALGQCRDLLAWLQQDAPPPGAPPSQWCCALETSGWSAEAVVLAVCHRPAVWRILLRWWGRWRHVRSPLTAAELIQAGWSPGPGLGAELRRLRWQRIDQEAR